MKRNQGIKVSSFYWLLIIFSAIALSALLLIALKYTKKETEKDLMIEELKFQIAEMQSAKNQEIKGVDSLKLKLLNENLLIFEKKIEEQSQIIKNNDKKIKELERLVNQTEEECSLCFETLRKKTEIIEELEYLLLVKDIIDPDDNSVLSGFGKVSIAPGGFFREFIEIIGEIDVAKAILRNRNGVIVREFKDPKIINTNDVSPGVYYLSFYNEKGELIQAAQAVCKRSY